MKYTSLALMGALALAGCTHPANDGAGAPPNHAGAPSEQAGPTSATSKADKSKPLDRYDKHTDSAWLTYVLVSRLSPQLSDERKMEIFSTAYDNETDAFKKHDLLVANLPTVNRTLATYKAQSYYVWESPNPFSHGVALLKPYDFNSQSFRISDCPGVFVNSQGVRLRLRSTDAMCHLKITDPDTARTIEQLRVNYQLGKKFTTYFFVDGVDPNRNEIQGTITHLHVDLTDTRTHRIVTSLDID